MFGYASSHAHPDLTLGTSGLGRGTVQGSPEEATAVATARAFLTSGFARVDTANEYADGRSEAVLGLALRDLGDAPRAEVVTKVDRERPGGRFDGDRVRRSLDESLARLGIDRVPLLHLHDPYSVTFAEALSPGGAVEALVALRAEGVVDAIGIAAGPVPLMRRYVATGAFDAVLTHNRYTLVDRSALPLIEEAAARGMTVFNAAPFGAGILATGDRPDATYGYRPATPGLRAWVAAAERACAGHGVPLRAAALHFSLRHPLIASTVVGVSTPARVTQLRELRDTVVPDALWDELDALGPAPTPLRDEEDDA